MSNHYEQYYIDQAGRGIDTHRRHTVRQKGDGFFGRFLSSALVPLVRTLGPIAIKGARHLLDKVDPPRRRIKRKRRKITRKKSSLF